METILKLLHIRNINVEIEQEIETDPKLIMKRRTIKIFQMMDELDQYTNPSWFFDLSISKLKLFYKELEDIENKRQIFNEIKSDGYKLLQEGKIDSKDYYSFSNKFKYAYARTLYGVQGDTLNSIHYCYEDMEFINGRTAYTAISRLKQKLNETQNKRNKTNEFFLKYINNDN